VSATIAQARVDDIFAAIEEHPGVFISLRDQAAVAADYEWSIAQAGPLAGVILAVKDNVDVAGLATTAACPGYSYLPEADAPVVAALRTAGAVVLGKTNLDQFATGLVGTRSPYGAVPDSRRPDRISGGSSSGSAVAVALGLADIAIGTDTAGSGRIPAALQGVIGIKPTVGLLSTEGVVPACADYDTVTIFARTLEDADAAMSAMVDAPGPVAFDVSTCFAAPAAPAIAVPAELPELDADWRNAFERAVAAAEAAGMTVRRIDLGPFIEAARLLYDDALVAQRYDAVGDFLDAAVSDQTAGIDPTVGGIIGAANRFSAVGLLRARRRLTELRDQAMRIWGDADALLVPTAPLHPTIAQVAADPVGVNSRMGTYTNFCNLFDLCGVAVPAGTVDEADGTAAEFGITFLGKRRADAVVLDLARRFVDPELTGPTWVESAATHTELAVFGAHMRGGPLEHELAGRGARWTREVTTAPSYRLVALDTVPPKPGLIRDPERGRAIVGQTWTLSPAALGEFLAALPEPMMLGKVELSDGQWVVGFGCAADAAGAGVPLDRDRW